MTKLISKGLVLSSFSLFAFLFLPGGVAAASYQVSGWVPWFNERPAAERALEQIDQLDVIYPFVFEVAPGGIPVSKVNLNDKHWQDLFAAARARNIPIIPTIAWFDGAGMEQVLGNPAWRQLHVGLIALYVQLYGFDGINIDYEQKLAVTKDSFSLFLRDLNQALGSLTLTCAVEARMQPNHRWLPHQIPSTIEYANDYRAINQHCDVIEIMAYDQQRADIVLNNLRQGVPYNPVADIEWVKHVLELALEDFDNDKVLLGVPTYGRAWDVTVAANWYKDYRQVASLNHPRILELANKYNAPIGRTAGGEAVITYFPEDSVWRLLDQLPTPPGTKVGYEAAAKALLVATYANIEIPVRMVVWSDAKAVADKLSLVESYSLKGVVLFKIDGEEDERIWELF